MRNKVEFTVCCSWNQINLCSVTATVQRQSLIPPSCTVTPFVSNNKRWIKYSDPLLLLCNCAQAVHSYRQIYLLQTWYFLLLLHFILEGNIVLLFHYSRLTALITLKIKILHTKHEKPFKSDSLYKKKFNYQTVYTI